MLEEKKILYMVSLAIIGARTFNDYALLCKEIETQCITWGFLITDIKMIISGHCKGADMLGEKFAKQHSIQTFILKPDWKKFGKRAGFVRNHDIIAHATHVIAFPSINGSGTQHSITLAQQQNKDLHVVNFDA